jgi:hypothetical protein
MSDKTGAIKFLPLLRLLKPLSVMFIDVTDVEFGQFLIKHSSFSKIVDKLINLQYLCCDNLKN